MPALIEESSLHCRNCPPGKGNGKPPLALERKAPETAPAR
jgi:hypothetical protein